MNKEQELLSMTQKLLKEKEQEAFKIKGLKQQKKELENEIEIKSIIIASLKSSHMKTQNWRMKSVKPVEI